MIAFCGLYATNTIIIDNINFSIMLEYAFRIPAYATTEYIAPIRLAKISLMCFIFIFITSPVVNSIM